jgi:hypothetical protein
MDVLDPKQVKKAREKNPVPSIRLLKESVDGKGQKVPAKTVVHPGEENWSDARIRHHLREGLAEPVSGEDLTRSHDEDMRRLKESDKTAPPKAGRR